MRVHFTACAGKPGQFDAVACHRRLLLRYLRDTDRWKKPDTFLWGPKKGSEIRRAEFPEIDRYLKQVWAAIWDRRHYNLSRIQREMLESCAERVEHAGYSAVGEVPPGCYGEDRWF